MNKKKICLIGQFPPPLHGLSKALDTLYKGVQEDFETEKIDITDNKKILSNIWKIFRSKADVFYFTLSQSKSGNLRDLWILNLIARKKKKCLVHLHGGYYHQLVECELGKRQRQKNYKIMQKIDGAIVLSPSLKPIFTGMVPTEKVFVVSNCIDDEFLSPEETFKEKISRLPDKKILNVLYLSNFNPEKGYKEVLALANEEKKRAFSEGKRRFQFHFAGAFFEEEEKKFFFEYIEKNSLTDFVTYHGVVDGEKKRELLSESDLFILLTRYPKEGQPISVLEAMGNGLAIITTDHAAIADMVQNNLNGIVCLANEEKDCESLYGKMVLLREDLPLIAVRNFDKARREYTEEKYLSKLKAIFSDI